MLDYADKVIKAIMIPLLMFKKLEEILGTLSRDVVMERKKGLKTEKRHGQWQVLESMRRMDLHECCMKAVSSGANPKARVPEMKVK